MIYKELAKLSASDVDWRQNVAKAAQDAAATKKRKFDRKAEILAKRMHREEQERAATAALAQERELRLQRRIARKEQLPDQGVAASNSAAAAAVGGHEQSLEAASTSGCGQVPREMYELYFGPLHTHSLLAPEVAGEMSADRQGLDSPLEGQE